MGRHRDSRRSGSAGRMSVRAMTYKAMCILGAALLWRELPAEDSNIGSDTAPAPAIDRVGFPKDYKTEFKVLGVLVKDEGRRVTTVYGNEQAATVTSRERLPYPNGSVLLMEFSYAVLDADGQVIRNADGTVKTAVEHVDVMRRERGFGEAYGVNRTGEWEYAGYRLDGSYTTRPEQSAQCAACHRKAGAESDFVFRMGAVRAPM